MSRVGHGCTAFHVQGMDGAICPILLVKRALPLSPLPNLACNHSRIANTGISLSHAPSSCYYLGMLHLTSWEGHLHLVASAHVTNAAARLDGVICHVIISLR